MPLYTYTCECGRRHEDLFKIDGAPSHMRCPCGSRVARDTVYRNVVVGPVWDKLDTINSRMLSPGQRRAGMELKGKRDIERMEDSMGVYRPEAYEGKMQLEEQRHDAAILRRTADEGGLDAAYDYIEQTDIMEETGWDKDTTRRWMDEAETCQKNIESGALDVKALGRNPYIGEQSGFTPDPDPT